MGTRVEPGRVRPESRCIPSLIAREKHVIASTHLVQATGIRVAQASAPGSPALGYARLASTAVTECCRVRRQLAAFAASRGFTLSHVFVESDDTATSAFAALTEALRAGRPAPSSSRRYGTSHG